MIGQPANLRKMNQTAVIERLLSHGQASRAQIAKALGLSSPTVGKVSSELINAGVLEQVTEKSAVQDTEVQLGRPGVLLRVNETTPRLVLLQLGVRHTRLRIMPLAGVPDETWQEQFATPKSPAVMVRRLTSAAAKLKLATPWAVMVSTPGVVDENTGRVLLSPNLQWTSQTDLRALVQGVWRCQVHLVQEIRALALGQQKAASQVLGESVMNDFLLVDVGEGVGAAAVVGGRLFTSSPPLSGELGHTPVRGNTRACGCGGTGCLETLLSRKGLLQSLAEAGMDKASRSADGQEWSQVLKRVQTHGIESWLASTLDAGAMVIAGAMNLLGVTHVMMTGALAELPCEVIEMLGARLQVHAMWGRFGTVTCLAVPRRRAAGLMEAAISRVVLADDQPWESILS